MLSFEEKSFFLFLSSSGASLVISTHLYMYLYMFMYPCIMLLILSRRLQLLGLAVSSLWLKKKHKKVFLLL